MALFLCFLYLCCLCLTSQAGKLSLIGKTVTQSGNWPHANLAIDGDANSYTGCISDNNTPAYWQVDLGENYQIGQVIVTACFFHEFAKYLQSFSIWLLDMNKNKFLCYNYTEHFAPLETRSFPCKNHQIQTRYINIARNAYGFEPQVITLAEVNVMTGLPPSMIEADGKEIPLDGKHASQSKTLKGMIPSLAFDGDVKTFSMAEPFHGLLWWNVNLGESVEVGKVIITASHEKSDSGSLKKFKISLFDAKDNHQLCKEYPYERSLAPSETRHFRCENQMFQTRYVQIARSERTHKNDALSLAEVKVKRRGSLFSITPTSEYRTEIRLAGKMTKQSGTLEDMVGNLAVDEDVETTSVAESPTNTAALGWWEVDLEGNYQVGEVVITASNDQKYADYLCNFSIRLFGEASSQHLCTNYASSQSFRAKETRSFLCDNEPFMARVLRIEKLDGSHRKGAIALAEVRVLSGFH